MQRLRARAKRIFFAPGRWFIVRLWVRMAEETIVLVRHCLGRVRARRYRNRSGLRLNLGCGPHLKAGWVNVDLAPGADLALDLRKRIPLPTGSCVEIYSEHFFEHLDYPSAARMHLRECHRLLAPGGRLHVCVPDGEFYVREYLERRAAGIEDFEAPAVYPSWIRTPMEQLAFIFHQNYREHESEHRMAYDFPTLAKLLRSCGFEDVQARAFDEAYDALKRRDGGLRVVATRPA